MTNTPDQLDLEGGKAKSLGEKFFDVLVPFGHTWANFPGDLKVSYERHALAFAASLTHDETATAVIADLEARLRASEAECARQTEAHEAFVVRTAGLMQNAADNYEAAEALATSQAETISELRGAVTLAMDLVARDVIRVRPTESQELVEALVVWTAALSRTPSGEARPDTGEQIR